MIRTCLGRHLKSSNHCIALLFEIEVFMLHVFMLNTWFLFKWKIERFHFQHLIFIRFLGFTACGMPLCTKHKNFVWPLFLAILDFSNGACSEFRVTYIVACSRMRGNTVYRNIKFTKCRNWKNIFPPVSLLFGSSKVVWRLWMFERRCFVLKLTTD